MKVTAQLPDWPERHLRRREWVTFTVAAARVREKDLKKIIQSFQPRARGLGDCGKPGTRLS